MLTIINKKNIFDKALEKFILLDSFFDESLNNETTPLVFLNTEKIKSTLFNSFVKTYEEELSLIFESIENSEWQTIKNFSVSKSYALHHFYLKKQRPSFYSDDIEMLSARFKIDTEELINKNIISQDDADLIVEHAFSSHYENLCTSSNFNIDYSLFYNNIKPFLDHDNLSKKILDCNLDDLVKNTEKVKELLDCEIYALYNAFFLSLSSAIGESIENESYELAELNLSF